MTIESYMELPEATQEMVDEARKEANDYMNNGGGNLMYSSIKSVARSAVLEFILFKQGYRAKRN